MKNRIISWLIFENKNLQDNKYGILNLLFNSNTDKLTTQESIDLFKEIESQFEVELQIRLNNSRAEQKFIEDFLYRNNE